MKTREKRENGMNEKNEERGMGRSWEWMGMVCLMVVMAGMMLAGCEKLEVKDVDENSVNAGKVFRFTVKGEWVEKDVKLGTRGTLSADGNDMTDLWVFDFVGGECVQTVHQDAEDEEWGAPTMTLALGEHHVYFVASRGENPVVDSENKVIKWGYVKDTFWKDYTVNVVSTSNGNRSVTLDRMTTRLRLVVKDEVPTGCAKVVITPERWYYGLNYTTGAVAEEKENVGIEVAVPNSYVGTKSLALGVYGMSAVDEWSADVTVSAKDGEGVSMGVASMSGVVLKRNRTTEYSGNLFGQSNGMDVGLNTTWETKVVGNW